MADTAGLKHPSKRAYRDEFRPTTERRAARTRDWRAGVRELLGANYPNTLELWRGPSEIDGTPIVALATGFQARARQTMNLKIGDMLTIYMLPQETDPREAIDLGSDRAVCGSCAHRPSVGGDCYVNVAWAPRNLWRTWFAGGMPLAFPELFEGAAVRFGGWGDPAAVPLTVWDPILELVRLHTGYTQRWRQLDVERWGWLMASVSSQADAARAQALGWRTFRTAYANSPAPAPGERLCAAESDGLNCETCGACNGDRSEGRPSVWLPSHGFRASQYRDEPRAVKSRGSR